MSGEDKETKSKLAELQDSKSKYLRQYKFHESEIERFERNKRMATLTTQNLEETPEDTTVYVAAGRAYLLADRSTTLQNLSEKAQEATEYIQKHKEGSQQLEKKVKEVNAEIAEFNKSRE